MKIHARSMSDYRSIARQDLKPLSADYLDYTAEEHPVTLPDHTYITYTQPRTPPGVIIATLWRSWPTNNGVTVLAQGVAKRAAYDHDDAKLGMRIARGRALKAYHRNDATILAIEQIDLSDHSKTHWELTNFQYDLRLPEDQ